MLHMDGFEKESQHGPSPWLLCVKQLNHSYINEEEGTLKESPFIETEEIALYTTPLNSKCVILHNIKHYMILCIFATKDENHGAAEVHFFAGVSPCFHL